MPIKELNQQHKLKRGDVVLYFGKEGRIRHVLDGVGGFGWVWLGFSDGEEATVRASQCQFLRNEREDL